MSDDQAVAPDTGVAAGDDFVAHRCEEGHLTYPGHSVCPDCGKPQTATVALGDREATVVTWTTVASTPPGVREPNTLAIVEFDVEGTTVRAIGGTTTDEIARGDTVLPVAVEELRDPSKCIRDASSQRWDGVRFAPVE